MSDLPSAPNPYASAAAESDTPDVDPLATAKQRCLIWMTALFAANGLCIVATSMNPGFEFLSTAISILVLLLALSWCDHDAKQRNFAMGTFWWLFIFFGAPIAIPFYFFRSRDKREAFSLTVKALLFFIFLLFVSITVGVVVGGIAQLMLPEVSVFDE